MAARSCRRRRPSSLYRSGSPRSAIASARPAGRSVDALSSAARATSSSSWAASRSSAVCEACPACSGPLGSALAPVARRFTAREASAARSARPRPTAGPPRMRSAAAESAGRTSIVATARVSATSGMSSSPPTPTISKGTPRSASASAISAECRFLRTSTAAENGALSRAHCTYWAARSSATKASSSSLVAKKPSATSPSCAPGRAANGATARLSPRPRTASEMLFASARTSGGLRQDVVSCFFGAGAPPAAGKSWTKAWRLAAVAPRQP